MMELDTIFCGDALDVLRTLPDNSVHCCITSPPLLCAAGLRYGWADRARGETCAVCGAADGGIFRGSARASSKRHALAEHCGYLLRHRQQRRPSGPEESKRQERTGCIACAASGKCQSKGYADGSGYEARFTQCGICTLMKKLGLYDRDARYVPSGLYDERGGRRVELRAGVYARLRRPILRLRLSKAQLK